MKLNQEVETIHRILFVCTGNTCRSPMAEYLLKDMIKESQEVDIDNWEIISAGISAIKGVQANEKTSKVMSELGIDLAKHSSKNIKDIDLKKEDIIITMSRKHSRFLLLEYPDLADKIFTLKEFAEEEERDVEDPFGLSLEVYRETRDELEKELKKILLKLKDFSSD
ncbi:low molecular weight protein arginine phosphatase [Halanaerobium sp. Z-7514]|uniref:Low molecular weight protein arginine phosphatase n=1 Tax=Halanaerobium polyolivorans TaxID=2886943 RepID=A0AAW4WXX4_9FIRM|nr:low molecular weight protein arginine phosphatase [Halanaerobium polyolivorans]MCC3144878.1 low molecular weight protein arginine phosphatase [Halanaerobium polyolivorans]RQD78834.1 MAG: low molecular weight protein arginine phosphatase [Halanaerobium sp. MSAO_Bac5]